MIQEISITRQPVELFKILKFENLAESGGDAKRMIAEGAVSVNGQTELRKRRKIHDGDILRVADQEYRIVLQSQ